MPTMDAAVWVERAGQGWDSYLALHRHGGIEIGSKDTYTLRSGARAFRLLRIVGLLWLGLDRQAWALTQINATGPWEVKLVLHDTENALLADFAEGWAEPSDLGYNPPRCPEPAVVVRRELVKFPVEPEEVRDLAFDLGGRIEDAWGMKQRRFLNYRGGAVGEFGTQRFRF